MRVGSGWKYLETSPYKTVKISQMFSLECESWRIVSETSAEKSSSLQIIKTVFSPLLLFSPTLINMSDIAQDEYQPLEKTSSGSQTEIR